MFRQLRSRSKLILANDLKRYRLLISKMKWVIIIRNSGISYQNERNFGIPSDQEVTNFFEIRYLFVRYLKSAFASSRDGNPLLQSKQRNHVSLSHVHLELKEITLHFDKEMC